MSDNPFDVEFSGENDPYKSAVRYQPGKSTPPTIKLILRLGIAKNERDAFYVLIVIVSLIFSLGVYLVFTSGTHHVKNGMPIQPTEQELQEIQNHGAL